ncbi:HAD family acid phosphatase [Nocardia pseudobrasiliensis]|uniref:Putative acid phosphatase of HAD superfamily subfamily IIIB n=1 Tax=Nocardia pseudobrasiliensis TaxID=45979 RepID=A0A370IB49_9NOCA|nr:HAD family acid phosphatase [Nocardia pseudobrasiliensis]RDI67830.1 putative acid phosphatase of HAD superfamily subfamily IIIB [Nocardia pseudobrasiliensis]
MNTTTRSTLVAVIALAALVAPAHNALAADPLPTKQQWLADVDQVMRDAKPYLDDRKSQGGTKLAIVLDIDNTALQSHYDPGKATPAVLDAARHAKANGYSVLFASYRPEAESARAAVSNAGYPVDGICVRSLSDSGKAATKQRCRKQYTAQGYTITANIGNRPTDFEGANYEKPFKLPDYDGQLS